MAPPVVLTIAGYDPSSGAGVTADIKTIAAHGCYGVSCITALTVQSTVGVRRVEPVSGRLVAETLAELAADMPLAAIRIGMLGSGEVAQAVADFLEKTPAQANTGLGRGTPVVLDPILRSSSGTDLLDPAGLAVLRDRLIPLADVITPNIDEAAALAGMAVRSLEDMKLAAVRLHQLGARAVVITGGHLPEPVDLLSVAHAPSRVEQEEFPGERIQSTSTHGTGCAFATALACGLALGWPLPEAVRQAKTFVAEAMAHAYPLGRGKGPLNHLYRS
jgi:hydroxymethylpyrimidine/phosphomethylpyrimidine kinase